MKRNQIIIEGILNGEEDVIKKFCKDMDRYVQGFILSNQGSRQDVEDTVQEAMMRLYQKLKFEHVEIQCLVSTYFFGICKNIWLKRLRSKNKYVMSDIENMGKKEVTDPLRNYIDTIEQEYLYNRSFQKLSKDYREVLMLYFDQKSMREIAGHLGLTEGNARKKKFNAKKKLIEIVQQDPAYKELIYMKRTA